jgi:hypothetical protein
MLIHGLLIKGRDGFDTEKDDHRVGRTSSIVRRETIEKSQRTFLLKNFHTRVDNSLVGKFTSQMVRALIH